jgi:hypothetical protein
MTTRSLAWGAAALVAAFSAGCGPSVNLATDLQVADVQTGWYDDGIDPATKWNHLVPGVSLRLKNVSGHDVSNVQLTVAFWQDGADGMSAEKLVRAIGDEALAPGTQTEPIVVLSDTGYNLEGARADLFQHGSFRDWVVKLYAKRGGRIVPIGEHKVERRLILKDARPGQ